MRIGLIYYDEYPSGIKTYTLELGRALVRHGLHVRIFGQTATGDSPVAGADFSPIEVPESQEFLRHPIRRCREIGRKMESACRSLRIQSDVYHSRIPCLCNVIQGSTSGGYGPLLPFGMHFRGNQKMVDLRSR